MIERIAIQGFKSLKDVTLDLGAFNLLIGTNASGKSNFLDALRIVQGIAHGFTIDEIFNGKPRTSTTDLWEPIRGGLALAAYHESDSKEAKSPPNPIGVSVTLSSPSIGRVPVEYSIEISAAHGRVLTERLKRGYETIFDTAPVDNHPEWPSIAVRYYKGKPGRQPHLHVEKTRPVIQQIAHHHECSKAHADLVQKCLAAMGDMQRLDPSPAVLREYSRGLDVRRMGERGENFAGLMNAILEDRTRADAYIAWLKQLTPAEMDGIEILRGAVGEPLFALRMDRQTFPAPVLSDGTLRFAAIAAAFFQPDMPDLLMIEEIENGVHPTRLRLLMDLLKSQAQKPEPQVVATTHSPVLLSWLEEEDYRYVFHCNNDDATGASSIVPISSIPRFPEIVRRQPIAGLFAEGWLESAL